MAYDDVTPYYQQRNEGGGGFGASNAYDDNNNTSYGNNNNNIATPQPLAQSRSAPPKSGALADAIKEGWTLKKGPQTLAGWKKRYLQLSANKQLGYYTDESMVQKKGTIFLNGLTIHHIKRSSKTSDSKHHGFCVVTEKRTFQFCVANATDRDHWIQKIREVVDEKWDAHKIDKPSISYSSSQRAKEIQKQSNTGKVGNFSTKPTKQNKNNKQKYGYNNGAYSNDEEWDDDDEPDTSNGRTMKIKQNLLADQNNNNSNSFIGGSSSNGASSNGTSNGYDDEKEDRFAHRSKYKRRNQQVQLTEQEAQEQIQELEHKNEAILDEALRTTYETQTIAADTAQKLDDQRHQLIGIDKNLHEIDQDLDKTEGILDGMKSWGGMIKRKFKKNKDQPKEAYQAPVSNKSTFERREKEELRNKYNGDGNNNNNMGMPTQISQYEHDNVQNEKLDELLKNVKQLNATANDINTELDEQDAIIDSISDKMDKVAPRIQQQNHTMHKIIN